LNAEEKLWLRHLGDIGCIVCRLNGIYSPADIHHILKNGRRQSDLETIPLCPVHHRGGINNEVAVSRHPYKREFEKRYGTEEYLHDQAKRAVQGG
jgi:hypothetical protein